MASISLAPALAVTYFYISTFRSTCAVPNMEVFCSSLTSWFPGMVLTYFLNYIEMVPVSPVITGITLFFYTPHTLYCNVLIFQNLLGLFFNHVLVSWDCDIYQHTCYLFIIGYYNVWIIIIITASGLSPGGSCYYAYIYIKVVCACVYVK
jgi:hypothetical protein